MGEREAVMNTRLREFLFPTLKPQFFLRVILIALCAYLFFGHVLTPFVCRGKSMEPTYHDGSFNFIWKGKYWFSEPRRQDVVTVRLAGEHVVYLKRVVAFAGETVEFKEGVLFIDGHPLQEPYVNGPCNWNLSPRKVEPGQVYIVGDNRSMPMEQHDFGQTSERRIVGAPLW